MNTPLSSGMTLRTGSARSSTPDVPVGGIGPSEEQALERFRNALEGYLAFRCEQGARCRHRVTR